MNDRVVIVTGAARGLGRAMTLALAAAGAQVGAVDLPMSDKEMAKLVDRAQQGGFAERILPLHCDVSDAQDCAAAVAATVKRFGALHGLVNNAARRLGNNDPVVEVQSKFFDIDVKTWRDAIDTNVNGPFLLAKIAAPLLIAQGWGRIVNIVTSYPTMKGAGFSPYGPSKAALEAATVIWAKDLAGTGVTVNALLPGGPANTRMIPEDHIRDRQTLVQPEAMGAPIVWLMSSASDGVTGYRFIAQNWDPSLDPQEASLKAGSPAGWNGL
jgi:NAD(P)-dependent dehydrogenase (short-subunit alcohol dehydrogenase family)